MGRLLVVGAEALPGNSITVARVLVRAGAVSDGAESGSGSVEPSPESPVASDTLRGMTHTTFVRVGREERFLT